MKLYLLATVILASQVPSPCTCEVNVTWMRQTLNQHFSQARHHVTNMPYKKKTMYFIRDQFRDMGLEFHLEPFPTVLSYVKGMNVIGVLKGRHFGTDKDSIVGIGAHYDTMRNTPGVNDNGAAVVVMLQAARELSSQPPRESTVIFVAFDFEEWEREVDAACRSLSCGSRNLVADWLPNFLPANVTWKGIFVMDTIMNFNQTEDSQHFPDGVGRVFPEQAKSIQSDGERGDFLTIVGRRADQGLLTSFQSGWSEAGQSQYEIEQFILPMVDQRFGDFLRSDHYSFWLKNYSAIFITDTADFRGYMTKCYHHPCDTMNHVTPRTLDFMAKTCRTLISAIDSMSSVSSSADRQLGSMAVMLSLLEAVLTLGQRV